MGSVSTDLPTVADVSPTGDVKSGIYTTIPTGWLALNGDTIGSASSSATKKSANYETLFKLFWDTMADAQFAVSTGRGASAQADWDADKTGTMPDARGRALIGTGTGFGLTARTHGKATGAEDAINVTHNHGLSPTASFVASGGSSHGASGGSESVRTITVNNAGSSGTDKNMGPSLTLTTIIKW